MYISSYLQLSNNLIDDWRELQKLAGLKNLRTIYLQDNPICFDEKEKVMYSHWIKKTLPQITIIDGYEC